MDKEILLGREEELRIIHRIVDQRRNLVIFGENGAGKTAVIQKVLADRDASFILFSAQSMTLKESLVNFIISNRGGRNKIKGENILSLKKIVYSLLVRSPEYIVFDHLGVVGPRFCSFFEYLMDKGVPLLIACRSLHRKDIGHLSMWLFNFEKIEIVNLSKENTVALVEHYRVAYQLKLASPEDFAMQISRFSKGNPKIIKELCCLARDVKYQKNGLVDVKLMDLDRRIQEIPI